jgi:hypothetical protein
VTTDGDPDGPNGSEATEVSTDRKNAARPVHPSAGRYHHVDSEAARLLKTTASPTGA